MERLWYNLSQNVLEEMIKFSPRSKDEDCPNFVLEIEKVTPSMGRYILNLIDETNMEILCLTSAEYSKTFPAQEVNAGSMIRIQNYWVFRIECHSDNKNAPEFKYIIMISKAEIMKLPPAKSIVSITQVTSKTPRVHGIIDVCSDTCHGESLLNFRLRDDTGSIRCSASGAMYAPLHSILKEGVRVELSHAMVMKVDPGNKMRDSNFELKLNQFSVLKIYDSDDLNLLFAYSSQDIVKKLSDRRLEVNSSGTSFGQSAAISKLPNQPDSNQPNSCEQWALPEKKLVHNIPRTVSCELKSNLRHTTRKPSLLRRKSPPPPKSSNNYPPYIPRNCSNGKTPVLIASVTQPGICSSWIRGNVERHIRLHTVHARFHLRDQSTAIQCTVLEPACLSLNTILKDGMILEIADVDVKAVAILSKMSDHSHELVLTKFASINALAPHNELIYQYKIRNIRFTQLGKTMAQKESPKLLEDLGPKYIDGKLSMSISSLTTECICSSWIRGVVEYYGGMQTTRSGRPYTSFFIRDSTAIIKCVVWEPICSPLTRVLKENMIIETKNYDVAPLGTWSKPGPHKFDLYLNPIASLRIFSDDDTIVYEHLPS